MKPPAALPTARVVVDEQGAAIIEVDDERLDDVRVDTRPQLREALREVTTRLASPMRVEVREADGSRYVDILTPSEAGDDVSTLDAAPISAPATPDGDAGSGSLDSVPAGHGSAGGFAPAEQVVVAFVVSRSTAASDGTVWVRLPPVIAESLAPDLLLLGTTSGALVQVDRLS